MAGGLPYVYPAKQNNFWYAAENSLSSLKGSVNTNIDNCFAEIISQNKFLKLKENYRQITLKRLKKHKNSLSQMSARRVAPDKYETYRLFGDLIMANLYHNSDFSK